MNKEEKRLMMNEEEVKNEFHELIKDIPKLVTDYLFLQQENKQLKNIIDELEKWLEEYHKYQNKLKWNEKDYKNFIANLEKELKGSDSNE